MTLAILVEQDVAEHAASALIMMAGITANEHRGLVGRAGLAEQVNAGNRAMQWSQAMTTFAGAVHLAKRRGSVLQQLNDIAALVDVASGNLSVEDYGDALAGASQRLTSLIRQLTAGLPAGKEGLPAEGLPKAGGQES